MNDPANKNALTLPVSAKTSISIVDGSNNQKMAIASLSNAGDYEDSIFFTFNVISGNAVLNSKGDKTVTVQANPAYVASVILLSDAATNGEIEVYPTINQKLKASTDYTLNGTKSNLHISLKATPSNPVADGKNADIITATLSDINNNNISNEKLIFTLLGNSAASFDNATSPLSIITDSDGNANVSVKLKSTIDDIVTVNCALATDKTVQQSIDIPFKGFSEPQPPKLTIVLSAANSGIATSNGQDQIILTALLTDQDGQPISGKLINFIKKSKNTNLQLDPQFKGLTSKEGKATCLLTDNSRLADKFKVVASLNEDSTIYDNIDVFFNAAVPVPVQEEKNILSIAAFNNNVATSNGQDKITLTATLTNENDQPIVNKKINFRNISSNKNLNITTLNNGRTNDSGQVSSTLTDNSQLAESFTVSATMDDNPDVHHSIDVSFSAPSPMPQPQPPIKQKSVNISFLPSRKGIIQNYQFPNYDKANTARVFVSLTDEYGRPVTGRSVFLFVQSINIAVSRIVGIDLNIINPTVFVNATSNSQGLIQVNISQWRYNGNYNPGIRLFANFTGPTPNGPYIDIPFI